MKYYRSLFFAVLSFIIFTAASPVAAQNPPEITINEALVRYPFTVNFQLFATHEVDVESVTLIYGLNGRSCQQGSVRQLVNMPESTTIFAFWDWQLTESGSLPPGVTVWWEWEIVDVAGNLFTVERQEAVIEDDNHDWLSAQSGDVTVHWYLGDNSFGQSLLREATDGLERLENELGLPAIEPVSLWFYPTAADVRKVIFNVPEWTGGVAFPEYNATVLGVAPGELDWAGRIVPHELTHLVEGMLTFNCRGVRLPTWLSEGLARFAEGEPEPSEVAQVELALQNGRLPTLRSLSDGFSAFSDSASEAYTQSGQVVKYLIDTYGPKPMNELLLAMQVGQSADEALLAIYGLDTNGVDAAWRTAVGFAPTPTSAADAISLQATPTQIATVALGGVPMLDTPTPLPSETPLPTETYTPAPPTTETPTATETAVPADEITQLTTPGPTAIAPPAAIEPDESLPSWIWWGGGTAVLLLGVAALFFRTRKQRGS
ncbi:peptidase MA family metallohydrolase [Candidatus Leptofilum sp.]|uniref:peptidase MA family metallohydrolase n=1 Tax=Candidatus Leptofilum sp. TaxID=3241576 RepID=UPI003B58B4FD